METTNAKRGRSALVWLLLALLLVVLWWWLRPEGAPAAAERDHRDLIAAQAVADGDDPGEILVDLRDDVTAAEIRAIERDLGISLVLVSDQSYDERFYRASVDPRRRDAVLAALARRPEVEIAEPDSYMAIAPGDVVKLEEVVEAAWEGYPDDPKYRYQWHLRQIGMPEAWKLGDGDGVVVAVLDTGVAYESHGKYHHVEDLEGVPFVHPYDFVDNDAHANDDHGHGTHVTGTIAQRTHNGKGVAGVARNVSIMPLKVLGGDGRGSVAGIADAIRYAADNGAHVINMSLGGPFPSRVLKKACEYAHGKGVVIVAAAGNDGRSKVGYPAAYPGVIAVAATQYDESTTFYSNYGKDVDIAAPGGNTRVDQNKDGMPDGVLQNTIAIGDPTRSDYYGYMGTSMASPHVAGVAALVVGEGIRDAAQVERILTESARRPATQKYVRDRYGAGIVDAPAAIKLARQQAGEARIAERTAERAGLVLRGGLGLLLGLLVAGAVAAATRQRGVRLGPGYLAGAAVAVGAFTALAVIGIGGNALWHSALGPLALLAIGFGVRRLRGPLAGLAAGTAGWLLVSMVSGAELRWVPALFGFDQVWLAVHALLCIALAKVAIRR
jgi:serine protease